MDIESGNHLLERIVVRALTRVDLAALEWDGEYAHFRRLYREIYQSASLGRALMWVADLSQVGIIGQVFVQLDSGRRELADGLTRAYVYGFRVKPFYRSQGVGALMLGFVENDLRRRGFRWVTLNVGRENPNAQRFYERYGYKVVGTEAGRWSYLDDNDQRHQVVEPAWRMEKPLIDSLKK
jgi:ribosomal protein S18 acetylase RimI-like enzyme